MTARLQRCEIWTDYQAAGGSRLAVLPLSHISTLTTTERLTRDDTGTLIVSTAVPAYEHVTDGVVLRLLFTDGAFAEYRLHFIEDTNRRDELVATLLSPLVELRTAGLIHQTTAGVVEVALEWKARTPSDVIDDILAFCPAWWSRGDVDPTIPVDLAPNAWNPLEALRALEAAVRAQGVACELDYERNGTTGYKVRLVSAIGSSAAALDVRTGKNLVSLTRRRDRTPYAERVVPIGSGSPPATIARAWFEVTAVSGNDLTLQQPVTGGAVLIADDQLNGLYLIDDTGTPQEITDSSPPGDVTVEDGSDFTVGRWYRFAANASGDEMLVLPIASGATGPLVVVRGEFDGTTNFVPNAAMDDWPGAATDPPTGWTETYSGTITRTTTAGAWLFGGQSMRCEHTGSGSGSVFSPALTVYVPAWVTSVVASAWVRRDAGATQSALFLDVDGVSQGSGTSFGSIPTGSFQRVDYVHTGMTTGTTHALRVRVIVQSPVTTDLYLDAVQITFSASAQPFTNGSSAARLWAAGNRHLDVFGSVPTSYEVEFADLGQWDPDGFPHDAVQLGQTATVRDTRFNLTTSARIVELTRNWLQPLRSTVTINTRPDDFLQQVARRATEAA